MVTARRHVAASGRAFPQFRGPARGHAGIQAMAPDRSAVATISARSPVPSLRAIRAR